MNESPFISNNLSFVAAAALTGRVEVKRVGKFDFEIYPLREGLSLWEQYKLDQLVFSARVLAAQIGELKRTISDGSYFARTAPS